MVINKNIMRSMRENKSIYISSLFLIILSSMLFVMMSLLSTNMATSTKNFENNYHQEDANFVMTGSIKDIKSVENKTKTKIEQMEYSDYKYSSKVTIRLIGKNSSVNMPAVIQGKMMKNGKNEIMLEPSFAKAQKIKIGDKITIMGKKLKVIGFMSVPNYIYPLREETDLLPEPSNFGIAIVDKSLLNLPTINGTYAIRFNSRDNIESQVNSFKSYMKNNDMIISRWQDISNNTRVTMVTTKIESIGTMSKIMPIIFLLLTSILISIVMSRMMQNESKIIGTLFSLGYKKKTLRAHYIKYSLYLSVTGGVIGVVLGAMAMSPMLSFMTSYFNMPLTDVSYSPWIILIGFLLPILFLVVTTWFVMRKVLKHEPVELMRGTRDDSKVNFLERILKLDKLSFSAKYKIRSQIRSISRIIFLLFGVIVVTFMLMFGVTIKSSIDSLSSDSVKSTFNFQYEYIYNSLQEGIAPKKSEMFMSSVFSAKNNSKISINVTGIDPHSKFVRLKGVHLNNVVMTRALADILEVKAGDTVKMIGKTDAKTYSVKIDEIADTYVGSYIFMPQEQLNSMLKLPSGSYIGLWSKTALSIPKDQLYSATNIDDAISALNTSMSLFNSVMYGIAFVAVIIGLIIMYIVTSLVIDENRRNISLLKILGYKKRNINSLVVNGSDIFVVIGFIIGVPSAIAVMGMLFRFLANSTQMSIPVIINYLYIFIAFIVLYVTYWISKKMCNKKLNKIAMTDVLKDEMD